MYCHSNITMEASVINVERTLCLIKPDIIEKCDEILHIIRRNGFYIVQVNDKLLYRHPLFYHSHVDFI